MPPPVARESYTAALGNLRQILTAARDIQDAKEIIRLAFRAIEASAEISENLVHSVGSVEDKWATWELWGAVGDGAACGLSPPPAPWSS